MPATNRRLAIAQGEPRKLPPWAKRSAAALDLSRRAEVTLVVRSRGSEEEWRELVAELTDGLPRERRYLTHAELARKWAASPSDIEAVRKFAESQRLKVVSTDAFRRCVVVSGSLAQHSRAFDVELHTVIHPLGIFRSHSHAPRLPASIHPLIECVLGLDNLPTVNPHAAPPAAAGLGMNRKALLDWYEMPPRLHGKGQCIAIIELGGGYHKRDLVDYFKQVGLALPRIRRRGIGGVKNDPAPPEMLRELLVGFREPEVPFQQPKVKPTAHDVGWAMWTFETTLDIALAGTVAPEASILLVQSPNDDQGHYHAVTSVVADSRNRPSVLSCSWGTPEPNQTPSLMRAVDRWFQTAAVLGMTVCCSSGDNGDGTLNTKRPASKLTIQFPASSPHVLACGGTTLHPKARTEVTWNQKKFGRTMASGGGFSGFFPLPPWQSAAGIDPREWIPRGASSGRGRAIPDVAAKANLQNGYSVIVGGIEIAACGTSAATPLWAALTAILNEGLNARLGSLASALYSGALHSGLRDIVAGNNGAFHACRGWNPCTGWGSPRGKTILQLLRGKG